MVRGVRGAWGVQSSSFMPATRSECAPRVRTRRRDVQHAQRFKAVSQPMYNSKRGMRFAD